ncbi:hypothetical protein NE237_015695 [Protea cynaroides]|uniref:DUF761 domain-containing protein n=1 Tax=Protea cynaroides TaxID=273540 RepID=A0A9Q0KER4_9MAGN|nr:hypothetical protein NE237_015695 [Protea cynaroides]
MSCLSLGKKLRPAKKSWKGFTSTLQRKLHKLKRSKAIKKTTNSLNKTIATVLNRSPSFPSRLVQPKIKKRVITRSSSSKHHTHNQKFAPVYVDELFTAEPISIQAKYLEIPTAETTSKVIRKQEKLTKVEMKLFTKPALAETSKAAGDRGAASTSVVYVPPKQTVGVDDRAEEFIAKFKEEMWLQRQRSFEEYQEMLARGL